jgi:2-polyprenyl-3-methyl-5-hydroxy-6-metoxy-1,4-benzoquinol methylase
MIKILMKSYNVITHLWGWISRKYYFEDFVRVYPDGIRFNRLGLRRSSSSDHLKNFMNHEKFYIFAAQFVRDLTVADIGCGSGYGCAILKKAGAAQVFGADVSKNAIHFAEKHYGESAEFSVQSITKLSLYPDESCDLVISSEVLEHIKEYGKEDEAVKEVIRITRPGGVIIFGTPNGELAPEHGFSFDEIKGLMGKHFKHYCLFENALVPFGPSRQIWEHRLKAGRIGVIVTEAINLTETVLPDGVTPELKVGMPAGIHRVGTLNVDTNLLHNTHSWVVVAIRETSAWTA